jgi:prepilin-type N-terminal cleavage/methylation domain-containing protein
MSEIRDIFRAKKSSRNSGFTLLEILLVVAAIAILAGIVIFAVNPGEILAKMRNSQRTADVSKIANAVYQYAIDNNGNLPDGIPDTDGFPCAAQSTIEICSPEGTNSCVNFSNTLTENQKYLTEIPVDPQGYAHTSHGSGYSIMKNENNRVVVCAPKAELGRTIEVVK